MGHTRKRVDTSYIWYIHIHVCVNVSGCARTRWRKSFSTTYCRRKPQRDNRSLTMTYRLGQINPVTDRNSPSAFPLRFLPLAPLHSPLAAASDAGPSRNIRTASLYINTVFNMYRAINSFIAPHVYEWSLKIVWTYLLLIKYIYIPTHLRARKRAK